MFNYFDVLYTRFYVRIIVCYYTAGLLSSKVLDIVQEQAEQAKRERKLLRRAAEDAERIRTEHEEAIAGSFMYMITNQY